MKRIQTYIMLTALTLSSSLISALDAKGAGLSPEQTLPLANGRDAYEPAACWGKDTFLVVWKSGHLAEGNLLKTGLNYIGNLAACRVNASGKMLDTKPIVVSDAKDLQEKPEIAFGNGQFLVVWQDHRNGKDWDVYATRISPDGKVLDGEGILVAGGPHNQAIPSVTWDGRNFQVVWQDFRSNERYEVYGARVSPSGRVMEPKGQLLVTAKPPYSRYNPVIASVPEGGKCLLFWQGTHNNRKIPMAGSHFVVNGKVSGEPTMTNSSYRESPGGGVNGQSPTWIASAPEAFLAVWTTGMFYGRSGAINDAHGATFAADGTLQKRLILAVKLARSKHNARPRNSQCIWSGTHFIAAWDQYDLNAARKARARAPIEAVFAAEVDVKGNVSSHIRVAGTMAEPAIRPTVASDGKGTTLIAYEQHPAKGDIPIQIEFRVLTKQVPQR